MPEHREGFHRRKGSRHPSGQKVRVLNAVVEGLTNDEIAERLGISADGVKWHISELLAETGCSSRFELADWWRRQDRRHSLLPWAWPMLAKVGALGVAVLLLATLVLHSRGDGRQDDGALLPGADVGSEIAPTGSRFAASPVTPSGGKPFFAHRQMDYAGVPTVRLSGGDLPHPVTIPPFEFATACANATHNGLSCSAGASYKHQVAPSSDRTWYRLDFIYLGADYDVPNNWYWFGGGETAETQFWFVPGEQALVGPLPQHGWVELGQPVSDMLDRYIALARGGHIGPEPTLEQALTASVDHLNASVSLTDSRDTGDDKDSVVAVSQEDARKIVALLGRMEPVLLRIQGVLVGQREYNHVELRIGFGESELSLLYLPPGEMAEEAVVLSGHAALSSWGFLTQLSPPGYLKSAYRPPVALQEIMAAMGYAGGPLDVGLTSKVLDSRPERWRFIERIELWREGGERFVLPPLEAQPCLEGCELDYPQTLPTGEPLKVAIWPTGVAPFDEIVSPALYDYYPDDGTGTGRAGGDVLSGRRRRYVHAVYAVQLSPAAVDRCPAEEGCGQPSMNESYYPNRRR